MSQLDTSISFSNLVEVLICCYILVFYVYIVLDLQYYNRNLRGINKVNLQEEVKESNIVLIVKRIISL